MDDSSDLQLMEALAGSPYFSIPEPISDIAGHGAKSDLYLALARTIEREVIPRLLVSTRSEAQSAALARTIERSPDGALRSHEMLPCDIDGFCDIIRTRPFDEAKAYVAREIADGIRHDGLLLDLFAPTARRLGELWESDECSFIEVTFALGKLQQLLRLCSETYRNAPLPEKLGFRACLATIPDNQHVFGILVVEELFRRAGWNVLGLPSPTRAELLEVVAQEWFAVVGLSIGCDDTAKDVAALIAEVRAASLNRSVLVLVGGRYITDHPEQSGQLGADLAGVDAQEAIERSQDFLRSIGR